MTDTSTEAVERLAAEATSESWEVEAVETMLALAAERDALRAEVQRAQAEERDACHETLQRIINRWRAAGRTDALAYGEALAAAIRAEGAGHG